MGRPGVARALVALAAAVLLGACATGPTDDDRAVELPPLAAGLDYQLSQAYTPPDGVRVVVRDSEHLPAEGLYNVCYLNAFQSQPDDTQWWLLSLPSVVLRDAVGRVVADPVWPEEVLFDTSSAAARDILVELLSARVRVCAAAGFDAIELDNLDSFARSDGRLTVDDNLALVAPLITEAHVLGLAVAQKNASELGERGRRAGFDFAITEECEAFDECTAYTDVYGRHVLEIEYTDSDDFAGVMGRACAARGAEVSIVGRDRGLVAPGDDGYVRVEC